MLNPVSWDAIVADSADPRRCAHHLDLLRAACGDAALAKVPPEGARVLGCVLAGSRALPTILCRHPAWLAVFGHPEALRGPRRKQGLEGEMKAILDSTVPAGNLNGAVSALHDLRLRELLRIGARDLGRLGPLSDLMLEVSNAADVFLDGVFRVVWEQYVQRFGQPWHQDPEGEWHLTAFCVLGLGKLGGHELNYSSDVDLLFAYSDEGATFRQPPKKKKPTGSVIPNHQFFKRLGEALVKEASGRGIEGGGLRIDMRLRPEGDAGPLVRSLDSYETFYAEWGQTWERMMLLKARCVAGDPALASEFLEVIQPFRYPRSLGPGIFQEMAEMKARLERDVVRAGELERNVKLGRGGIREIEFVAQTLQVLHGGRIPFLQTPQTLEALPKLVAYHLLSGDHATALTAAYPFLRDVEHRLQLDGQRQTHTLPTDPDSLTRIARLMGFTKAEAFKAELGRHMKKVRDVYDRVVGRAEPPSDNPALPGGFEDDAEAWKELLAAHRFRDPVKGVRLLREFVEGPGFVHVARRTSELGRRLIPRLLELCPPPAGDSTSPGSRTSTSAGIACSASLGPPAELELRGPMSLTPRRETGDFVLSDPDRVLARLDSYITTYGTRALLFELWTSRPNVFGLLLKLFDRSEFLAELAVRDPDLVDQLEAGNHLRRQKDMAQTLAELRFGAKDEDQRLWLRRYFQTEFMRLGLRDILGLVGFEEANAELTALAEACLRYALEVVTRKHRLRVAPFAVIALGKFGGGELVYGSDLDVMFVAPDSARNLPRLQRLAGEVIDLLTARTEQGSTFVLDTRLRPDGEKGLLVNVLKAHEDYYRNRAMLWEIQALTRARAVAGHPIAAEAFVDLARRLANFKNPSLPLAALTPDWKEQIARMRLRIERERTPPGREALAFKTGAGGLVDAEFLSQTLALEHGWFEANTLRSLERARDQGVLPHEDAELLIGSLRRLRQMESILRRWSFEGEAELPVEPAALYRVAVRCGFTEAEAFVEEVRRWRAAVRSVYLKWMPPAR